MASFSKGTSFTDGVTGDVTAAKLHALVDSATPVPGFITDRTAETSIADDDLVLISDTSESGALNKMTVSNLMKAAMTGTINSTAGTITAATIPTLTAGTTTGTAATFTSGTITTLNSTTGTITTGVIPTLTAGTTTSTAATITTGTIPTLVATTLITSGTGTAAAPAIVPTGDTNTGIFFPAADTIALSEGGTEAMRIDSSGRVGIGMTPAALLDISKSDNTGGVTDFPALRLTNTNSTQGNGTSTYNYARIDIKSGNGTVFGDFGTRYDSLYSGAYIGTESSHPVLFQTGGTERLRIDSSGNVGIGTTSPGAKLGVSDGTVNIQLSPDSANSRGVIGTAGNHSIEFHPNGTARLTIVSANGTLTSQPTYDNTAAGSTVVVTSAGLIRRTSSSIKYKKDVENLYGSIVDNAISNLRPVWYRTKNPEGDDKSTWSHIGLIAEEVSLVEPRLVKYKTVEVSVGENGERVETQLENPIPEDVDYARLSVILLSEVKAQKIKIASLEARIEALEAA